MNRRPENREVETRASLAWRDKTASVRKGFEVGIRKFLEQNSCHLHRFAWDRLADDLEAARQVLLAQDLLDRARASFQQALRDSNHSKTLTRVGGEA